MSVSPTSKTTSALTCKVEVGLPGLLELAGALLGTPRAIRNHVEEETAGFAADILKKVRDPAQKPGSQRTPGDPGHGTGKSAA
jgi:hypothetical protein